MRSTLAERIRVASGNGQADLLIRNGRVVDVFSGQVEKKDVAVYDGTIIGFGDYRARRTIDVQGQFLCPGLIDGHVHVESSMVTLPEFARAILPHGTTSIVIDPHEIANVLGARGDSLHGGVGDAFAAERLHHGAFVRSCDTPRDFREPSSKPETSRRCWTSPGPSVWLK